MYLLPSRWSLHYIMTDKRWSDLRDQIKRCNPRWHTCSCPEKRTATQLHEEWSINRRSHHKLLLRVAFLCPRCHGPTNEGWFPVGEFGHHLDLDEYLDGRVDFSKEARFSYLGNSAARAAALKAAHGYSGEVYDTAYAETKKAYVARFMRSAERLRRSLKDAHAGGAMLLPYRIDLSVLGQYGCDTDYVRRLERLAVAKAEPVMQSLLARIRSDGQSIILYVRDQPRDWRTWGRLAFSLPGSGLYTL